VGAVDWRPVPDFDDVITLRHPSFDVDNSGRMRSSVAKTPCNLFLAFFPMELVEPRLMFWREHATEHDRKGFNSLDDSTFLIFLAVLLSMGFIGLRRRDLYFTDAMEPVPCRPCPSPFSRTCCTPLETPDFLHTTKESSYQTVAEPSLIP
jgi:hypothetical protein